jgi:DNA-binding transcriptional LysR family regulator
MVADTRQALDDLSGQVQGSLTLVTSHHIGLHRLPAVLQAYRKAYPLVKLRIQFMNSWESHQHILAAESEVGITTEETMDADKLDSFMVWQDKLSFVVSANHPLSSSRELRLEHLCDYPALLPDAKFTTGRLVRELFQQHKLDLQIDSDLSTDYLETLKALVTIGDGWSVLPHTMTKDPELAVLNPEDSVLSRNLVCITHKERTLSRAAKAFIDILKKADSS